MAVPRRTDRAEDRPRFNFYDWCEPGETKLNVTLDRYIEIHARWRDAMLAIDLPPDHPYHRRHDSDPTEDQ